SPARGEGMHGSMGRAENGLISLPIMGFGHGVHIVHAEFAPPSPWPSPARGEGKCYSSASNNSSQVVESSRFSH
ncbi:MAG: hypothetical protein ABW098_18720, partial [Candidatus Thiodiazotropha sp.]